MKPSLQFKLSQHLTLTPQLQQSIRLLQLSTLELHQELDTFLSENPLLERLDDPFDRYERILPNGGLQQSPPTQPDNHETLSTPAQEADNAESTSTLDDISFDYSRDHRHTDASDEEHPYPQLASAEVSLHDHLTTQLTSTQCSLQDRALVTILIDEVNADGYLGLDLDEFASILPPELEIEAQSLSTALKLLQSFDPIGVGARNLVECLTLQLNDPMHACTVPPDIITLARTLVSDHLTTLAARDFTKLKRRLHCQDDALRAAHRLIRSLNPKPGAFFYSEPPTYVVPDVSVKKINGTWQAVLNREAVPRLRINALYAQILKRNRHSNSGLSNQLQEARWLIKNVQQRFETILQVSQAIVEQQRAFFSHGAVAMRPLVLREIADALGLHESTVSRVTTQKFMLTPFGTFELKYFFGSHLATDSGGSASSTAIRELIKQLISTEEPKTPLSDSQIAELLGEQGIQVARRTVAKYREGLRIPAVNQRKAL